MRSQYKIHLGAVARACTLADLTLIVVSVLLGCYFVLSRGCTEPAISVLTVLVVIGLVRTPQRLRDMPALAWLGLVLFAGYVLLGHDPDLTDSAERAVARLLKFVILFFAVVIAWQSTWLRTHWRVFALSLVTLWTIANLAATLLAAGQAEWVDGVYRNPHYLATNALIALALLSILALEPSKLLLWQYLIALACLALSLHLFALTESLPAYLAVVIAAMIVALLHQERVRLLRIIGGFFALLVLLAASGLAGLRQAASSIILTIRTEERLQIWTDTWRAYHEAGWAEQVFGFGAGGFKSVFPAYSAPQHAHFVFPHAYPIEILFDFGVVGCLLAVLLAIGLAQIPLRLYRRFGDHTRPLWTDLLLGLLIAWLLSANFVYPLFSPNTLYPLALLLGVIAALSQRTDAKR